MKKFYFLTLFAMLFCCLGINAAAELTFSNVSLAPGSQVATLAQDQQITFNTNMDSEIGYMLGEIRMRLRERLSCQVPLCMIQTSTTMVMVQ